jgi:hypothetical protein
MQQLTKETMKKALSEMPTGFENEDTVILVEDETACELSTEVTQVGANVTAVASEATTKVAPAPALVPQVVTEIEPPPLPFTLMRKKSIDDEAWFASLSPAARAILERAAHPAPSWPFATRVPGAIAMPAQRIPRLGRSSNSVSC